MASRFSMFRGPVCPSYSAYRHSGGGLLVRPGCQYGDGEYDREVQVRGGCGTSSCSASRSALALLARSPVSCSVGDRGLGIAV